MKTWLHTHLQLEDVKIDSIDVVVTFDGENQQIEAVVHEDLKIKKVLRIKILNEKKNYYLT